jgi:DNA-binding CsgD family transcriptional regulator
MSRKSDSVAANHIAIAARRKRRDLRIGGPSRLTAAERHDDISHNGSSEFGGNADRTADLAGRNDLMHQMAFLQNRFDLTRAEARLVVHLLTGTSLKSSAKAFGVTYETVRRQVKSVFHKTGTHRQSELVVKILRAVNEIRR